MKKIVGYLRTYMQSINKPVFVSCCLLIILLIFLNYTLGISAYLNKQPFIYNYTGWYFIFLLALSFPYAVSYFISKPVTPVDKRFIALLLIAPALFAWKMAAEFHFSISTVAKVNAYWNQIIYWPAKLAVMLIGLLVIWRLFNSEQPFYGTKTKGFKAKPYWIMLLLMVPLITWASTQPDFLAMYPKLKSTNRILTENEGWKILLYELSYGSDFVGIELFFRGFLVLAFAKWVGKEAILPMALFYCTIHFGKPLGECISSFFGGLILGVVTYHTQTIWGGLMVHLGIAWLMELGGYIGNNFL